MKTAWMVIVMIAAACTAGAQVLATEAHSQDTQKHLQLLLEQSSSTAVHITLETKAVTGAPYSAEAVTEFVQVLGDGNRIVRRNTVRVYRDSAGRTRRENLGPDGQVKNAVISDPAKGVSYLLHPDSQTAHQTAVATTVMRSGVGSAGEATAKQAQQHLQVTREANAAGQEFTVQTHLTTGESSVTAVGPLSWVSERAASSPAAQKEDLGQQTIEGVVAKGTRSTTVIPAGAIGNEQPITVTAEEWFSPDLRVLVMTKHVDPRAGETTYRLTNVVRSEPDPSLFERPAHFVVK